MSRLVEMEINKIKGASVDELRSKAEPAFYDQEVGEDELCEDYEDSDFEEEESVSPLAAEFMEINPLLNISTAEKMVKAEITVGQAREFLNESDHRRKRVKFICKRIEGLTSREIADMIGMKNANAIYKHVDKLNEICEDEGFYYELITSGQKKVPTKKEIEQYEQRLASL